MTPATPMSGTPFSDSPSAGVPLTAAARAVDPTKVYGPGDTAVAALDDVTVDFAAGQFTAIMGPSGSGKSTLMHCMAGLDTLTSGQVFIGDIDLSQLNDKELTRLRRDRIGFVFQAYNLVPTLTALENITLPMDLAGRKPDQAWLDQRHRDRRPRRPAQPPPVELSGGQQQRVAVARALASRPADRLRRRAHRQPRLPRRRRDPGLHAPAVAELGQTIVMVTHDPVAAGYADRVVFLADGRSSTRCPSPPPTGCSTG